jgi:hypothetical protein
MKALDLVAVNFVLLLSILAAAAQEAPADAVGAKAVTPGTYQLRNQKFKDLLRPRDANGAEGTRIVLYPAQPWKCMTWNLQPAGAGAFRMQNLFTSKTITADAQSSQAQQAVIQVRLDKESGPTWQLTKLEDGSCKITESKSGKALTAVKTGDDGEAKIIVEPWRDQAEQKWELQNIDPKQLTM